MAVCSWSLQAKDPADLVDKLRATGVMRVQLALDPPQESPAVLDNTIRTFRKGGIAVISGMVGCVGEDYSTMESIRLTGGVAPDETWELNLANFQSAALIAGKLGLKLVTFHAGFLDHRSPAFKKMRQRVETVAEVFKQQDILLGLETGQETAEELVDMLRQLDHPNLCVNFDPANMIMYGKGDPVRALHTLAPWVRQVHIKDAIATRVPGTWGEEVPVGSGQVDWRSFFAALKDCAGTPPLVIEREAGLQRVADIRAARVMLEEFFG